MSAWAQTVSADRSTWRGIASQASFRSPRAGGSLVGVVRDADGRPIPGAIVSAVGRRTITGTTDLEGRVAFESLPAGEYLVRVHRAGFDAGHSRIVRVRTGAEAAYSFVLHRATEPEQTHRALVGEVLAAGFVGTTGLPGQGFELDEDASAEEATDHDHSEAAWRLRHLPRSVLKETAAVQVAREDDQEDAAAFVGRAVSASARAAVALFADAPLTAQVNLLTTSTFDTPDQFLSDTTLARGVAYVSVGSQAGPHGDWLVQGALTQGDVAAWAVASSYRARAPAAHRFELGMTYAVQRYAGNNPDALAAVADGTRYAGTVFAYDTWEVNRALSVVYGARYARYGYIEGALFSPRARVDVRPLEGVRIAVTASRREEAPGAEEFLPSGMPGPWLPPELTFSALSGGRVLPERTEHYEVAFEHDLGRGGDTVLGLRAFRQRTDDQFMTVFGDAPAARSPAELGHYYVATAGDVTVSGWGISVGRSVAEGIRGSIEYRVATAQWQPVRDDMLLALALPSIIAASERLHDVTTALETEIPGTATRIVALCRFNAGFRPTGPADEEAKPYARFDVRVTQALPFLDFTSAQWEMLVGVRNMFRDMVAEGSLYDELLVLRPPKRVVGGLTVRF
ncbi:MAG TPA: TonB-dependent receptor [Vicinamibacterales bacterium]|nr:TonB-dependent receptor [Vicinamibacterales bacterium]